MLIERLFAGTLDVVGDVHGELEVLDALLGALGYDDRGRHRDGRRLVFVGDLIDRGPKSLAVLDRVRELVEAGRAQCVLGNHELNALRYDRKEGNDWFFDTIAAEEQTRICAFFGTLPLALEREDLRVVHACWEETHVARLRHERGPVVEVSQHFSDAIDEELRSAGLAAYDELRQGFDLGKKHLPPPMLRALAERNVRKQVRDPVKVLTSGLEEVAPAPFFAGGRWRFERRVRWWDDYGGRSPMVVVGHYWRSPVPGSNYGKGENLFDGVPPSSPLGPDGRVMCVDYCIGKRSEERDRGVDEFETKLAAYRWPERELRFSPA